LPESIDIEKEIKEQTANLIVEEEKL